MAEVALLDGADGADVEDICHCFVPVMELGNPKATGHLNSAV